MTYPQDPYGEQQPQLPPGQQQPPYGQPYPPPYGPPVPYGYCPMPQQEQGMAIASLVCSLVGIVLCGLTSILGIIFGHVAYSKAKRGEAGGQGMAQAGMIIGYVTVGLWLIPFVLWVIFGIALLGGVAGMR
ncbi:DUF4190 domain-containing protein [Amycolatopsis sp. NPDC059021]|uniref:DUF4190 domain-containing protein n=1 Tax=Amycolatopsis sp. NPDC059021 TaxID=3346704 RepID=UPI0036726DBD